MGDFVYKDPGPKTPISGPIDQGYWVTGNGVDPKNSQPTGYLENVVTGEQIYIWVTEMLASFSISGSYAQTQTSRSFYPRNLGAATVTLQGISPNSFYYQRLAEFVRATHLATSTPEGGLVRVVLAQPKQPGAGVSGRGLKGPRQGYDMYGYIPRINRGATRFNFYPTYQFDFLVIFSQSSKGKGLFDSSAASIQQLQTYTNLVLQQQTQTGGFVQNPNTHQAKGKGKGSSPPPSPTPSPVPTVGGVLAGVPTGLPSPASPQPVSNAGHGQVP